MLTVIVAVGGLVILVVVYSALYALVRRIAGEPDKGNGED